MKKSHFLIGGLLATALAGCGGSNATADSNTLVEANFDSLAGWLPELQSMTLSRVKAHSGQYSLLVDGAHEFSLGYRMPLGQLHETRMQKIKVSAWALQSSAEAQASLVVTISDPNPAVEKPLLWEGINLGATAKPGTWGEVSKEITLPANVQPTNTLGFYLWRTGGSQPVYLDDVRITLVP